MLKWEDVTRLANRLNGVPVLGCRPGSPAAVAGVRYGDILMAVNDVPTPDWAAYIEARQNGSTEKEASTTAARYMEEAGHVRSR